MLTKKQKRREALKTLLGAITIVVSFSLPAITWYLTTK